MRRFLPMVLLAIPLLLVGVPACGDSEPDPESESSNAGVTPDGETKAGGGKGDAWNWRNDPSRFEADLIYQWDELPESGEIALTPWTDTYWPNYRDSINDRWQGMDTLSPAEKWDKAVHGWEPDDEFMDLQPYDVRTCQWDDAYYDELGPTASWVHVNKGNQRAIQNDDGESCATGTDRFGGIETWWGLCHAWAPASIMEDEPLEPVEYNGVQFDVSDIKALLTMEYDKVHSHFIGSRCNRVLSEETSERIGLPVIERDETGRVVNDECRNVNAGTFHVIVTNFIGLMERSIIMDKDFEYEVWNQPITGYRLTSQEEIDLERVQEMLNIEPEAINAYPETEEEKSAVVLMANYLTFEELNEDVGLRSDRAQAIIDWRAGEDGVEGTEDDREFETLEDVRGVYGVGPRSIEEILHYARVEDYVDGFEYTANIYQYNEDAERFAEVRIAVDYLVESSALAHNTEDIIDRYIRTDNYHYILEMDADGEIIGGEWAGRSITSHPDFLWMATRPAGGSPYVDLHEVRELVRMSRDGDDEPEDLRQIRVSSDERLAIPDNDPEGVTSTLEVTDSGEIQRLMLDLDITHTYRGDLIVQLSQEGSSRFIVTVFDGGDVDSPWQDDLVIDGEVLEGFDGMDAEGNWELQVYDTAPADTGHLNEWSLQIDVE